MTARANAYDFRNREFDLIEDMLKYEYAGHAGQVDHYLEMADMAGQSKGAVKWHHLARIAQKMKDDTLSILNAYTEGRSLRRTVEQFKEVIDERRTLIAWLRQHPQEPHKHIATAECEADYFRHLMGEVLRAAARRMKGAERQREARALLAAM